jgi:hypothetical protein
MRVSLVFFRKDDVFMATKILSAKADVALLAKLTAEATAAKQERKLELLVKTELLKIANAINTAANKGDTEITFALSAAVRKLDDLTAIESEFTEQGYTFEKAYKSSSFIGYRIEWPAESEEQEEDPVTPDPNPNENQDPDPNQNPDPNQDPDPTPSENQDPVTPDPDPNQGEQTETEPVYDEVTDEDILALNENEGPVDMGWYELDNETYVLSQDTEVDEEKTYYKLRVLGE